MGGHQRDVAREHTSGGAKVVGRAQPAIVTVKICENAVGGGPAATGVGVVENVIMEQCGGLKDLDGGGHANGGVVFRAAMSAMRREYELRPEAFASDGRRRDLVHQVGACRSCWLNGRLTCRKGVANPCVDDPRTSFNLSIHADQRRGSGSQMRRHRACSTG